MRDASAPPLTDRPEVCSKLALPAKLAPLGFRRKQERLDHMRDGSADEAKVDSMRALEAHCLERGRNPALHRREVRCQHHVAASLPQVQLGLERTRSAAKVGPGDNVEQDVLGRSDCLHDGSEWLDASADTEVERQS